MLAAGETAGRVHGARRLGGNALSDALVFGTIAGEAALEQPAPASSRELEAVAGEAKRHLEAILERESGPEMESVRLALQTAMDRDAMVVREETGLHRALETVRDLRRESMPRVVVRKEATSAALLRLRGALELDNLLLTAEAVAMSALERRETRGNHFRLDHPERDDPNWRRNVFVERRGDDLVAVAGPLNEPASPSPHALRASISAPDMERHMAREGETK